VWLTPHLRDPQPEGERERESDFENRKIWGGENLADLTNHWH